MCVHSKPSQVLEALKAQTYSLTKAFQKVSLSERVLWTGVVNPKSDTFSERFIPGAMTQLGAPW